MTEECRTYVTKSGVTLKVSVVDRNRKPLKIGDVTSLPDLQEFLSKVVQERKYLVETYS